MTSAASNPTQKSLSTPGSLGQDLQDAYDTGHSHQCNLPDAECKARVDTHESTPDLSVQSERSHMKIAVRHYYLGPFSKTFTETRETLEMDGGLSLPRLQEKWGVRELVAFIWVYGTLAGLGGTRGTISGLDVQTALEENGYVAVTDALMYQPPLTSTDGLSLGFLYNNLVKWWGTRAMSSQKDD